MSDPGSVDQTEPATPALPSPPPLPPQRPTYDAAFVDEQIAKNKELAALLEEYRAKEEEKKLAELSELEKANAQLATFQKKLEEANSKTTQLERERAVTAYLAAAYPNVNTSRLHKLIDYKAIVADSTGSFTGIDAAVATVAQDYPELFKISGVQTTNPSMQSPPLHSNENEDQQSKQYRLATELLNYTRR